MTDYRSLTQDEAAQRAELLQVERYDVTFDFTGLLEGDRMTTTSTVAFSCTQPGASTFVEARGIVASASLNGVALDVEGLADGRLPLPDLAESNTLTVTLHQDDTASSAGILRTVDPTDDRVYVWTSFEPDEASKVFACFDQPDLKAVFGLSAIVPDSWVALSNTAPSSVTPSGSTTTYVFEDSPRLSTYNMVVNAGPFHEARRTITTEVGDYDLGFHCRRSLVSAMERDLDDLIRITAHGLGWFGSKFDFPFPQRRYDQIFVPDIGGAMENWGAVTYTDNLLHRTEATHQERSERAEFMLHEMAHMWFGDLVTMRWWDDLWLNEAFATWASFWAMTALPEYADAWASFNVFYKQAAYDQDMSPATHPIRSVVPSVSVAMANFDQITYQKGMSVLRQLHAYLGEEAYVEGLRAHFRDHAYGNATLADLMSAFGTAAGVDLSEWTTGWLDHSGTDTITLSEDRSTVTLTPAAGAPLRPHRFDVASYAADGSLAAVTPLLLTSESTAVDLPDAAAHQLNAGDLTFAATRSDEASRTWLAANAGSLGDPTARALAVTSAWNEVVLGLTDGPGFLTTALAVVRAERNPALLEDFLGLASRAAKRWTPLDRIAEQQALLADAVMEILADTATPVSAPLPVLRTLADCAGTDEHFAVLDASDDLGLAWRTAVRRAALGRYDQDVVDALLARDPDPEAWVSALAVRAAAPDTEHKAAVWQKVMVERNVPRSDGLYLLTAGFWQPGQEEILAPFTQQYLDVVESLGSGGGMLALGVYVASMYPSTADREFLAKAEKLASSEGIDPAISSLVIRMDDRLERMLRARGL